MSNFMFDYYYFFSYVFFKLETASETFKTKKFEKLSEPDHLFGFLYHKTVIWAEITCKKIPF